MNITTLLRQKGKDKEYFFAMTQYALYQLSIYSLVNKSELLEERREAVENTIEHYKRDYEKYSPFLKSNPNYKKGLRN